MQEFQERENSKKEKEKLELEEKQNKAILAKIEIERRAFDAERKARLNAIRNKILAEKSEKKRIMKEEDEKRKSLERLKLQKDRIKLLEEQRKAKEFIEYAVRNNDAGISEIEHLAKKYGIDIHELEKKITDSAENEQNDVSGDEEEEKFDFD